MKTNSHRFLCALCALTVFISALFPASAFAAQAADSVAQTTLTTAVFLPTAGWLLISV